MSSSDRLRGQEVVINITRGGDLELAFNAITNFNVELEFEVKETGFLGEKANRVDYIYKGAKFDFEAHTQNQDWIPFVVAVQDKGKRNDPTILFNIDATLQYSNGQTPNALLPDVSFSTIPISVSARTDYVKHKLQGQCDDVIFTQS